MPTPRLDAINPNEVLLYLGYKSGAVPAQVEEQIAACSEAVLQAARPRAVWCALALEGTTAPAAGLTLEGEDMKGLLSGCHEAVFLAATLGPEVEQLLRRAEVVDMAQALTLDAAASAAIEAVCDNLEADFRQAYAAEGLYLTDRFSPGYGDLPLAQQKDFCALLDTQRRIGLTLSGSCIMVPRKSVTAVMGVSPTPKPRRARGCQHCSLFRSCPYRHDGRSCGNA
ncbi:MAG: vitamin B12 dependent methionine synthase, activation domain protein [Clostridiales bacterium]|nr:vitamin B12 dependent methionine synthase, activation domain protein [Clostridiales bacterium]